MSMRPAGEPAASLARCVPRPTPEATFLQIAEHCNREQFDALVGTSYAGIVVSDRWNGFSHLDPDQRQVCWSHRQRDFRRRVDGLAEQKTSARPGLELARRVFAAWRAYENEHHDCDRPNSEIAPIQTESRQLLERASPRKPRNHPRVLRYRAPRVDVDICSRRMRP